MQSRTDIDLDARAERIAGAMAGAGTVGDPRVDGWLVQLADRHRRARRLLADALARASCLDAAALRLLEADADVFEDHVLYDRVALARFVRLASQSARFGRALATDPSLAVSTRRESARATSAIAAAIDGARGGDAGGHVDGLRRALRRRRLAVLIDVLDDEVTGRRAVESTAMSITRLAEDAIADALSFACAEAGVDIDEISVIGMGKLGAGELNPASDVDLVCVATPTVVARVGPVVRRVADLLETRTDDGIVFRVDLRLRPFGASGPVVVTPAGLGEYFERHAQPWERGVWAKARVVAGGAAPGADAIDRATPFVWRRSIDQAEIDEMAAMKARVQARARAGRPDGWDVKHGDGGIREVEFFVQALVLLAGGRDPSMRVAHTPRALARLSEAGLIGEREHFALLDAWRFLRILEHRVQLDDERQTHRVPTRGAAAERLARRLGYDAADAMCAAIDARTAPVRRAWGALLGDRSPPEVPAPTLAARLADVNQPRDARVAEAGRAGFRRAERLVGDLERLTAPPTPLLGPWAPRRDAARVAGLVDLCVDSVAPDRAFERVRETLERASARGTLLRVADRASTARVLVTLFAASRDVGRMLARSPEVLDDLIAGYDDRTLDARLDEHLAAAHAEPGELLERQLERLRRFRAREQARVVLALIGGRIDVFAATAELTRVAERCVDVTGQLAEASPGPRRHGVVAFGKLGAEELGHGSDLDLAFVYDGAPEDIGHFAAVARRHVAHLSRPMAWGRMYAVDLRLRPDGGQGTLVTPWSAFASYYAERARPWEVVALTRARSLHPDPALSRRIDALFEQQLDRVDPGAAASELGELRADRCAGATDDDVKEAAGGLADLELLVTVAQLRARRAGRWRGPRIGGTRAALTRLGEIGAIAPESLRRLVAALEFFRTTEQWLRIAEGDEVSRMPSDVDARAVVVRRVLRALPDAGGDFDAAMTRARSWVLEALAEQGWAGV